jgi:outer membrane protein assembly factor BamB
MRRRFLVVAGVVLLVILVAGAGTAYYLAHHRFGGNVVGSPNGFVSTQTAPPPKPHSRLVSPMFGVNPEHLHVGVGHVRPPFRLDWQANGTSLVEFPPALGFGHLYYATYSGNLRALSTSDGDGLWTVRVKRCQASGPAISRSRGGTVFETFLNRGRCTKGVANPNNGLVLAVSAGPKPKVHWRRNLGASETSPTLAGGRLYIGTAAGDVFCLDADNGRTIWRYHVGAAVKGAIAHDRGKVFFGAYDGKLYALGALKGKLIWTASSDRDFRGGHGYFYSTPAVAYSRVYIGSTDGRVYAFDERTGHLVWRRATGGYVYASPAVNAGRVFIGSYDHTFYALNAATGSPVWTFRADGPISGSAAVVAGIVYFSHLGSLGTRHTYGLDQGTGRRVWTFPDGAFGSVVTDGSKLYLVGWGKIYAFSPRRPHSRHPRR